MYTTIRMLVTALMQRFDANYYYALNNENIYGFSVICSTYNFSI
jgi:ferritin-like protein